MILCYHDVDPEWNSPLAVTPDQFRRHCRWLAEHRRVVPLQDVTFDDTMLPARGTVVLTFDDGFRGVYEHAFPLLVEYGLPATVFLVGDTLRPQGHPVDWVDGEKPGARGTMTVSQVVELRDAGIDLQSHTSTHRVLPSLPEDECLEDLTRSKETLEEVLDRPVDHLAYPRGRHDSRVRRAVERAGFQWAYSLPEEAEHVDRFAVPRVGVFPGNGPATLALKTHRSYLAFRHSRAFPLARRMAGRSVSGRGRSDPLGSGDDRY